MLVPRTHRPRRLLGLTACILVLLQVLAGIAGAAVPEPGADRALWGGTQTLLPRESALGRPLDVVRAYSVWETGPPQVNTAQLRPMVTGGRRTLLVSATIPWSKWAAEATRRNGDSDATNDVPVPYCGTRPVIPGTSVASGKTWFQAVADGDYDTGLRRWLEQLNDLSAETPALYVSLHHEADRLSEGSQAIYQQCVGTPDQYRSAWHRLRLVAEGTSVAKPDLTRRNGGRLVLTPIFTGWGFWHTASGPGTQNRAIANAVTGQPLNSADPNDKNLWNARVTPWVPAADDYDILASDVFNLAGSAAGISAPKNVRVDDPATTAKETDHWRSLEVLSRPFMLWATNWAGTATGPRPLMLAEYGSVPDPTRPTRRAAWLGDSCRFLTAPANSRVQGALYFDQNEVRLTNWRWQKAADSRWSAVGNPSGTDTGTVSALAAIGGSTRFGGTSSCPS
jgi:hypothetical protein